MICHPLQLPRVSRPQSLSTRLSPVRCGAHRAPRVPVRGADDARPARAPWRGGGQGETGAKGGGDFYFHYGRGGRRDGMISRFRDERFGRTGVVAMGMAHTHLRTGQAERRQRQSRCYRLRKKKRNQGGLFCRAVYLTRKRGISTTGVRKKRMKKLQREGGEGGAGGRTTAEPTCGEGRPGRVKGGRPPGAPHATRRERRRHWYGGDGVPPGACHAKATPSPSHVGAPSDRLLTPGLTRLKSGVRGDGS